MKLVARLAIVALIAFSALPTTTTMALADGARNQCQDSHDDDCRKKPKFQTRFFSED